jgi:uncharacterized repeat protein (TIGR03987 family)
MNYATGGKTMLIYAIITITLALVFYSIGVWSEKISGSLRLRHLVFFWIGFVFDTTGTTLMANIAGGGFRFNFHGISGLLAIVLMLIHAVWATAVLLKNDPVRLRDFHRFSIIVWLVWLVPFVSGAIFGIAG